MLNLKSKLIRYSLLTCLSAGVVGCGTGEEDTGGGSEPPNPNPQTCDFTAQQTLEEAKSNYSTVINSLSQQNSEFTSRTGSFDKIYNLGQFLKDGNYQRQIEVNELPPETVEDTLLSGGFSTSYIASESDMSSIEGTAINDLIGFSLAFERAREKQVNKDTFIKFDISFEDIVFRQVDNTQEVIEANINNAPHSNQFVYGIYEAKITNKLKVTNNCSESVTINTAADIAFFNDNASNSTATAGSSENEVIITTNHRVPVGALIRDISETPITPHNINTLVTEGPEITLKWDIIDPKYAYRVYYSANSNFEIDDANVEKVAVQTPEFNLHQGLSKGQTLYFKLTAFSGGTESEPSARIAVTIPIETPSTTLVLSAAPRADGTVRLQWSSPDDNDAIEYTLFRKKQDASSFVEIATIKPNTTQFVKREFIDSNLSLSTTYVYQLSYNNYLSPPASPRSADSVVTTVDEVIVDNMPPEANAGENIDAYYGDSITLNGGGSTDDNNEIVSFSWTPSPDNPIAVAILDNDKPQATFVAPTSAAAQVQLNFVLTVSDGVSQDSDTVTVTLTKKSIPGGGNQVPQAIIEASANTAKVGETITLSATNSTDADGDTLSYKWNQIDSNANIGIKDLTDAQVSFQVPQGITSGTIFNILLEVSDGFATDTAVIDITVTEDPIVQGDLKLYIESSLNPIEPLEGAVIVLTVANDSGAAKTGVELSLEYPQGFSDLSKSLISDDGSCNGYTCSPGKTLTWSLGTIPANTSTFVTLTPTTLSSITNSSLLSINANVTDSSGSKTTMTYNLNGSLDRLLELSILESGGPSVADGILEYELTYGFSGSSTVAENALLTFQVPEQSSFLSASNGGVYSENVITWQLGRLEPGETGKVKLKLNIGSQVSSGSVISAFAEITDNSNKTSFANTSTGIKPSKDIGLTMSVYPKNAEPGERVYVTLTALNATNEDIEKVDIYYRHSKKFLDFSNNYISDSGECSYYCDQEGEFLAWDLGTLKAGSATTVSFTPTVAVINSGSILKMYAELEQDQQNIVLAKAHESVAVIDDRQLELSIETNQNPTYPGENLVYKLNYSLNAVSTISTGTTLSFILPDNTTFVSASSGAVRTDRVITWPLERLDPGESGIAEVTLNISSSAAEGSAIKAEAVISDEHTPGKRLTSAHLVTPIESQRALELNVTTSANPVRSNQQLNVELIVNNKSDFKRSNLSLNLRYPKEFQRMYSSYYVSDGGSCRNGYCEYEGEFLTWNIGDIEANSTKTFSLTPWIKESLKAGTMIELNAELEQGTSYSAESVKTIIIRNDQNLELITSENKDPVLPGELLTYSFSYASYATGVPLSNAQLEAKLPSGVEFVAASNSGVNENGVVTWNVGEIAAGDSSEQWLTVRVSANQPLGSTLKLESSLKDIETDPLLISHSDIVTRVETSRALELAYNVEPQTVNPGTEMKVSITVNNTDDFERSGIWIALHYPTEWKDTHSSEISDNGYCVSSSSYCRYDGEFIWWNIGNLPANGSKTVSISPQVLTEAIKGMLIELSAKTFDSTGTTTRESLVIPVK